MMIGKKLLITILLLCSLTAIDSRFHATHRDHLDFYDKAIMNYSSFVFDPLDDVMYLAARNYLIELNITSMSPISLHESGPTDIAKEMCHRNWKPDAECENFLRISAASITEEGDDEDEPIIRTRFLICSSNAHRPFCDIRSSVDQDAKLLTAEDDFPGRPRDVLNNYVSLVSMEDQNEVVAYSAGFVAADMLSITKSFGRHKISSSSSSAWLHKPVFIAMHEDEQSVFIFFRESALEAQSTRNEVVFARVARVCKNDAGRYTGPETFADEALWSTFAKVRLVCSTQNSVIGDESISNSHAVYYDFLQDVHYDPVEQRFAAVFLNKDPLVWGARGKSLDSAVCSFSITDIRQAFTGRHVYQDSASNWRLSDGYHPVQCGAPDSASSAGNEPDREADLEPVGHFRRPRRAESVPRFNVLDYGRVLGVHSLTLRGAFVQQIVTRSVDGLRGRNRRMSLTYLLDSHALLHTAINGVLTHAEPVSSHSGRLQSKFYEMKLYSRNQDQTADYLVIINSDRVIRVTVSTCERWTTEHDCMNALDSQCAWYNEFAMCFAKTHRQSQHQSPAPTVADGPVTDHSVTVAVAAASSAADGQPLHNQLAQQSPATTVAVALVLSCENLRVNLSIMLRNELRCKSGLNGTECTMQPLWNVSETPSDTLADPIPLPSPPKPPERDANASLYYYYYYCSPRRLVDAGTLVEVESIAASVSFWRIEYVVPIVSLCAGIIIGVLIFIVGRKLNCFACLSEPTFSHTHAYRARLQSSGTRSTTISFSSQTRLSRYADPETCSGTAPGSVPKAKQCLIVSAASHLHLPRHSKELIANVILNTDCSADHRVSTVSAESITVHSPHQYFQL